MPVRDLLPYAILLATSCSTASSGRDVPGCRTNSCVEIGAAQDVWEGLKVTPMMVVEDSRCPIEAECVWEGRVTLDARLDLGHESIEVALRSDKPMRIHGGFLAFAEIAPDMSVQWHPIKQSEYRFAFKFTPDTMPASD